MRSVVLSGYFHNPSPLPVCLMLFALCRAQSMVDMWSLKDSLSGTKISFSERSLRKREEKPG